MFVKQVMLKLAIELLQKGRRYKQQDGVPSCCFTYVNLKREVPEHREFFALIDQIANQKPVLHPRLSEYAVGDYCAEHIDTIPDITEAVSVRFDSGLNRLVIGGWLVEEGNGKVVRFDPKLRHEVLPILSDSRIVLIFWLGGE